MSERRIEATKARKSEYISNLLQNGDPPPGTVKSAALTIARHMTTTNSADELAANALLCERIIRDHCVSRRNTDEALQRAAERLAGDADFQREVDKGLKEYLKATEEELSKEDG